MHAYVHIRISAVVIVHLSIVYHEVEVRDTETIQLPPTNSPLRGCKALEHARRSVFHDEVYVHKLRLERKR